MLDPKGTEMHPREMIRAHAYPLFAAVGTLSLVISSFALIEASKTLKEAFKSIEPISKWAEIQNDCVERTFRINEKDTRGLSSKVWSCNGGGY